VKLLLGGEAVTKSPTVVKLAVLFLAMLSLATLVGCPPGQTRIEQETGLSFPPDTVCLASAAEHPVSSPDHKEWAKLQFPTSYREWFLKSFPGQPLVLDKRPTVLTSPYLYTTADRGSNFWNPSAGKDYAELVFERNGKLISMLVTRDTDPKTTVYMLVANWSQATR
jgi:hypothetical protein